jgi:hypothetical protein
VAPSEVSSAAWTLRASGAREEDLVVGGTVAFDNLEAPLQVSAVVSVPECQGITETPGPQETETPSPQATNTLSPQETTTPAPTPPGTPTPAPVPEPSSLLLVGLGLSALVGLMRKRR